VLAGGAFDADADLATYLGGSRAVVGHTPGFVSHFDSMDMAERQAMTLQFLRPAQIDRAGNLNTSRIGSLDHPNVRFPGGLATADVPSLLPRVIAYLPDQRSRNVVADVSYRTGPGHGLTAGRFAAKGVESLVTDLACFRFEEGHVSVSSIHPWVEAADFFERTGFEVEVSDRTPRTPLPSTGQLEVLESIDPEGIRQREIRNVPVEKRG
jgi:glutaconate CoA-transferase subunit B